MKKKSYKRYSAEFEALIAEGEELGYIFRNDDGGAELMVDPDILRRERLKREEERAARKAQQERDYAEMWAAENTKTKEDNE